MTDIEQRLKALEARLESAEIIIDKLSGLILNGASSTVLAPFRVVDQEGKRIFEVDITEKGTEQRLRIFNPDGEVTAALGTDIDGGNLVIKDKSGTIVSYLSVGPDGARFTLNTSNGSGGVAFYTDEEGGGMVVSDVKGQISAELHSSVEGGVLVLRDDKDNLVIVLPPE